MSFEFVSYIRLHSNYYHSNHEFKVYNNNKLKLYVLCLFHFVIATIAIATITIVTIIVGAHCIP